MIDVGDVADANSANTTVTMSADKIVTAIFSAISSDDTDDDNDGYTNIEEWLHTKAQEVEASISTPEKLRIK